MLLFQALEHASEVVADEVFKERLGGVSFLHAFLLQEFVGEVGTCLEGEVLRLAKGVVTVEEDILDLQSTGESLWWLLLFTDWRCLTLPILTVVIVFECGELVVEKG